MYRKYLWYLIRHKWHVFRAGMKLGVPLWAAIIHDWQKFLPAEWDAYMWSFYGPWDYKDRPQFLVDLFDFAWLHHIHYGPHHWQYWLLVQDDEPDKILPMPDRYRREMLADWIGAGKANNTSDTRGWYLAHREKIKLHPDTRKWIEHQLGVHDETNTI